MNNEFMAVAQKHKEIKKMMTLWNLSQELEEEVALDYSIKIYILYKINGELIRL